ncbi:MAG: D-2-hydroxyacid dehydrogenase [Klebsiella michiganensis]|nr:D-2-hydroxyacid dehydrogenase [Klebsiella michiganensis]
MKNIVFLDYDTLPNEIELKKINGASNLICYPQTSASEISDRVRNANIIITNKVKIPHDIIEKSSNLELIAIAATGTDIIDLQACRKKGVTVVNIRNYAVETVPEHTFALMLNLRRNITAYQQSVQLCRWQQSGQFCFFDYQIKNLSGAKLGIIGDGVLGKRVSEIAKCFGMQVVFSSHTTRHSPEEVYADFDEVITNSDIITLHCPLRESTKNMISSREFKMMKSSALLINTARGGLVNETDLYYAITQGEIAGAAFDVAVNEPPGPDELIMKLTALHNFILTPHISWASTEAIQTLVDILIENINAYLEGAPQNVVV